MGDENSFFSYKAMHILKTKLQLLKKIDIECYDFFLKKSMLRKYTISGTEYTYVYDFSVCLMCVEQLFITKESRVCFLLGLLKA